MIHPPDWLPPLVLLEDCGGNWEVYVDLVYSYFKADFIDSKFDLVGKFVKAMREPLLQNKEADFWHLTSEGPIEPNRLPDLRRCERIRWPRPIIQNHSDTVAMKCWRTEKRWKRKHGTRISKRINLWLCEEYIVILAEEKNYFQIVTAYCTTFKHERRKLLAEYEEFVKQKKSLF